MNTLAMLSDEERRIVFDEASALLGLPAISVEKDFWVCWMLKTMFGLEGVGESLVFKGGTSLSKAYGLIQRFSEDIDIVVDREKLGFLDDRDPEAAPSRKQRRKRMGELREACGHFVKDTLAPTLEKAIAMNEVQNYELSFDDQDVDGQTLLFRYPSVYAVDVVQYLRRDVKIELGARSDTWPVNSKDITPYAAEVLPDSFHEPSCRVRTIAAERTFLDKVFLLHEENLRPSDRTKKERLSRHYYDLYSLLQAGIGKRALEEKGLIARVIEHRSVYFRQSWVDYDLLSLQTVELVPRREALAYWRDDYVKMSEAMFFGDFPAFDEILRAVGEFESLLRAP